VNSLVLRGIAALVWLALTRTFVLLHAAPDLLVAIFTL
jgi:hypothetical protein